MNLFNQKLCRERIARFDFPTGEKATQIEKIIAGWQYSLKDRDLSKTKEKSIQGSFLIKFFEEVLGYTSQTSGKGEWNLIQHPASEVDAQEPDGSLGFFTNEEKLTKAVIELKDAKTLLDKKQTGREKGYTPIEQAYLYATKFDRCNWIIVSNFREIRLYNKNRTQDFFEKFDVLELHGITPLTGEKAQATLRGRPRGRLGTAGSGNGRLRGRPRRFGSTQGEGATLYVNNSATLQM